MKHLKIKSIIEVSSTDKYDLEVEDNHNFFANGLLVHNCRAILKDSELWSRNGKQIVSCPHLILDDYLLDGDGCISIKENTTICKFNLCGTEDMVQKIGDIIKNQCNLPRINLREGKNLFLLDWGGIHQLRKIRDYLYKDATIYLERKYNKFQQLN